MSTMIEIEGKDDILEIIEKKLEQTWKRLKLKYRKVKGKILFAQLFILNLRYIPSTGSEYPTEDPNWFRSVLKTLDTLLEHDWSLVDTHMTNEELSRFGRIVLQEFSELGKLRQLHLECRSFNIERLEFSEDQSISDATITLDIVFDEWLKTPHLDEEWLQYGDNSSTKASELLKEINQALQDRYNVTLEVLYRFERDITKEIENRLEPEGSKMASLIGFHEEHLIERLHELDSNVDVKKLVRDIEYKPRNNWMLTPFVRLKDNSNQMMVYFPIVFAFYPKNVFAASWMYHISKIERKSSALGIMSERWGRSFEVYVREKLTQHHPHLKLNQGRTKISRSDFPVTLDCIGKPSIEIDVVALSKSRAYLISCKALDQFSGPKMLQTLLGSTFDEFERKLMNDLEHAGEIEKYAECMQQSKEYIDSKGWGEREVVPILMTSDIRPLSLESARQWLVDVKIVNTPPELQIIQAKEISGLPFK